MLFRSEHDRKAIAVSIGLVCRRIADADDNRAHDPDPAYPVHSESGRDAGHPADGLDHGFRHLSAILVGGRAFGVGAIAVVLFPLARRNPALLLRPHATYETNLHSSLRSMVVRACVTTEIGQTSASALGSMLQAGLFVLLPSYFC